MSPSHTNILAGIESRLHPVDWLLMTSPDLITAIGDLSDTRPVIRSFMVSFFMQAALGGITTASVRAAWDAGCLYTHKFSKAGLITHAGQTEGVILTSASGNAYEEAVTRLRATGFTGEIVNLPSMVSSAIVSAQVTHDDLRDFLLNIGARPQGGKLVGNNRQVEWAISKKDGDYLLHWGKRIRTFRSYFALHGVGLHDGVKLALIAMGSILSGQDAVAIRRGVKELSCLWVDEVTVGWSSSLYDEFLRHKVALLSLTARMSDFGTSIALKEDKPSMLQAAASYDAAGMSVFMHKGAGYIIADASMVGFHRNEDGAVSVAWKADKYAKLTGRALFCVPTAAEYIEDDLGLEMVETSEKVIGQSEMPSRRL